MENKKILIDSEFLVELEHNVIKTFEPYNLTLPECKLVLNHLLESLELLLDENKNYAFKKAKAETIRDIFKKQGI